MKKPGKIQFRETNEGEEEKQSSSESSRRCRKSKAFGLIFHHSLEQECLEFDGKLALTTTGEAGELDNRTNSGPETKMNNSLLTFLPEQNFSEDSRFYAFRLGEHWLP